jgi:hypothetical protein
MEKSIQTARFRLKSLTLAILLVSSVIQIESARAETKAPEQSPPKVEPKALNILRAACDKLSGAKSMSFKAVDTYERAARNGQPLYYTVLNRVTLQRPDRLRVIKLGDGIPDEFYYDGKTISVYVPSTDLVAVADAPPTIDQMLDAAWHLGAVYFPFGDVIASKPCAVFDKMTSAFYVGQSVVVGGTKTDMVALAADGVQAELWIGVDDHLPRMVRVVYTNEPAHAHYQTEYSDWKLNTPADATAFRSNKVATAKRIGFTPPGAAPPPRGAAAAGQAPAQPGGKQ